VKPAAIYARVSKQKGEHTIASQTAALLPRNPAATAVRFHPYECRRPNGGA
jgi:hypothetical protein